MFYLRIFLLGTRNAIGAPRSSHFCSVLRPALAVVEPILTDLVAEERALVQFFGDEYVEYRRRVGTMMPLIG